MQVASTYLERGAGNANNSLCNWAQLPGITILLALCDYWTTDLCDDRAIFNCPVNGFFYRSTHQWGVFL